jgi:hypothetical protein
MSILSIAMYISAQACLATVMQNTTKFPWNDYDYQILAQAKKRCPEIWSDSPCVKLFKKFGENQYSVVCSK